MQYNQFRNSSNFQNNFKFNSFLEKKEFWQLVDEVKPMKFHSSSQVSNYIRQNKLERKYPHISGELDMSNGSDSWKFKGGISPRYYAMLCQVLGLGNKGTSSRVEGYRSYASIYNI